MLTAWVVCLAGWGGLTLTPDVYEASARVFVDTESELVPVLRDRIIAPDVRSKLEFVREVLLSPSQLDAVASSVGLYAESNTSEARDVILQSLSADVQIESTAANRDRPDNIYTITFRHSDQGTATGVVSALLENFVSNTQQEEQRGTDSTERFVDEQVALYEGRLEDAEAALADFKKRNAERLPGSEGDYFDSLQGERNALEDASRALRILEQKRETLLEQLRGEAAIVPGAFSAEDEPAPNSIDGRIREYQSSLDKLLLDYTERHPDVIAVREALGRLLDQRARQLAAIGLSGEDLELTSLDDSPVYQSLRISLTDTEVEIGTLRAEIVERQAKMEELQSLIDEVPRVEAELARLNRDYDVIYEQYIAMVRSRETQQLTRKASDAGQIGFSVMNPPMALPDPVAPPRLALQVGILLAGLGAGVGICFVLAQVWPIFTNARNLQEFAELPVLGTVSHAWETRYRKEKTRAFARFFAVFTMLAIVFFALASIEVVGPGLRSIVGLA
jgi:polysaccharide chain length determinant protein (PEP-CTERM system associated)